MRQRLLEGREAMKALGLRRDSQSAVRRSVSPSPNEIGRAVEADSNRRPWPCPGLFALILTL